MTYLLTAIDLPPGGSSTVHIYTQTILPIAGFHFPNSRLENRRFTVGSPYRPFR